MEEEVKLLGSWMSPFVIRAKIALHLKGIKYEFLQEVFGAKSELLLKSNPVYKKIPVLIHNGKPVCESMIIVQYIEDVWATKGASLLPSDPYDRATARFWAVYIDDKMFPSIKGIGMAQTEEAKVEATSQLNEGLQLLEEAYVKSSKGKKFFNGENIGYLDIAFGCYIALIKATEKMSEIKLLDEEKIPHLVSWVERFCAGEAVKEALPETERVVEFVKTIQAKFKNATPPTK